MVGQGKICHIVVIIKGNQSFQCKSGQVTKIAKMLCICQGKRNNIFVKAKRTTWRLFRLHIQDNKRHDMVMA